MKQYIIAALFFSFLPSLLPESIRTAAADPINSNHLSNSRYTGLNSTVRFVGSVSVPSTDRYVALLEDRTTGKQDALESGEKLSNRYQVLAVNRDSVNLRDLADGNTIELRISGGLGDNSAVAQTGARPRPQVDGQFRSDNDEIINSVRQKNGRSLYGQASQIEVRGAAGIEGLAIYNLSTSSLFSQAGIQDGDVIRMVNSMPITKIGDYYRAIRKKSEIEIFFERAGRMQRIRIVAG